MKKVLTEFPDDLTNFLMNFGVGLVRPVGTH